MRQREMTERRDEPCYRTSVYVGERERGRKIESARERKILEEQKRGSISNEWNFVLFLHGNGSKLLNLDQFLFGVSIDHQTKSYQLSFHKIHDVESLVWQYKWYKHMSLAHWALITSEHTTLLKFSTHLTKSTAISYVLCVCRFWILGRRTLNNITNWIEFARCNWTPSKWLQIWFSNSIC